LVEKFWGLVERILLHARIALPLHSEKGKTSIDIPLIISLGLIDRISNSFGL
jgi:hypothetical protein